MTLFADAIANLRRRPDQTTYTSDWMLPTIGAGAIELTDGLTATYAAIYRGQPWVWAAVNKISKNIARIPLKLYAGDSDNRVRVRDGDLAELLAHPAPGLIPFRYFERTAKSVALFGTAISVKLGADGRTIRTADASPTQLMPTPATGWRHGDRGTFIWTSGKNEDYVFERWQLVVFRFDDPDKGGTESQFGTSFLEPLRYTLAMEDAARRYGVATFKNGARPSSILKTDQKLAADSAERLKVSMTAIHGNPDNAFKMAVLEQGLDWAPWPSQNLEDTALVAHRKLTREEVAAVFDIPQPTIGILDEANFASVQEMHVWLYQDSLSPWLTMIEQTLQMDLVDPQPNWQTAGLLVEFDMHGALRGSDADQARIYATALSAGYMTANEVRQRENLPPSDQPEADMLHFPLASSSGAVGAQIAEDTSAPDNAAAINQNGAVHV